MYKGNRILGLIPARGGSKGVPRKNLRELLGKPLIAWSIDQALASDCIDRLIVSTEDEEIAEVAKQNGADVPFMRPMEFADDDSPVSAAILHALECLKQKGEIYDIVILIECTSPVRYPGDIDNAIATLVENETAESVVGAVKLTHEHPAWTFRLSNGYLTSFIPGGHLSDNCRRQALEPTYLPYSLYVTWCTNFERYKTFYQPRTLPYPLNREQMAEVDDEIDFFIAESIMKKFIVPAGPTAGVQVTSRVDRIGSRD
jgi:CMP-N,N'-diacetyllegionaminic acid synthase